MRQILNRIYLFCCALLVPLLAHKMLHDGTGLFHVSKIRTLFTDDLACFFHKNGTMEIDIKGKRFYYLGRGNHAFAFESEDGKYVIKFLRFKKFAPHFWTRLPWFSKNLQKSKEKKRDRLHFLLNSISLAEQSLQEETGLITVSMLPKGKSLPIILVDRWGKKYEIDLSQHSYILQHKFPLYGSLVPEAIPKEEDMAKLFEAYFEVIGARFAKGIMNKDRRGWAKNYGTRGGVAYEIDLGGFSKATDTNLSWEISQCARDFRTYIQRHAPQFIPLFDKKLKEAMRCTSGHHHTNRKSKNIL